MTTIKFLTWNVRGMRDKIKRTAAFAYLKSQKSNVIVLTETHITGHLRSTLKRPWIGWAYHSTHTNFSRGVTLMVTKNTPFELISVQSDHQGRYLFLHAIMGEMPVLLLACYVPPPYSSEVVKEGLSFMAQYPTVPAVWMGDFNMTMNPYLVRPVQDGTRANETQQTRLSRLMEEIDVWRYRNPKEREYTCHSTSYATMSRIGHILVSKALLPKLSGAGFAPRALSDHSRTTPHVGYRCPCLPRHLHLYGDFTHIGYLHWQTIPL